MLSRANERREGLLLNTDPYQDDRRLVCPPPTPQIHSAQDSTTLTCDPSCPYQEID